MPPRVLVVDDEPGVRESLRMLLRDECELILTGSVAEALRALGATPPELVLLDLGLPDRSGFDFLAELTAAPDPPPVIVLSGTKTVSTAVEAMKRGASDYVTKPFELEALRIKVRRVQALLGHAIRPEFGQGVSRPHRSGRLRCRSTRARRLRGHRRAGRPGLDMSPYRGALR